MTAMTAVTLESIDTWAPHDTARPRTDRSGESLCVAANGTRTCTGGWQLRYTGVQTGTTYAIRVEVDHRDVACPADALQCVVVWGDVAGDRADMGSGGRQWDYLVPETVSEGAIAFTARLTAPADTGTLTVRYTFRWSAAGESVWSLPRIEPTGLEERAPVRIAVVTGHANARRGRIETVEDNVEFYAALCRDAAPAGDLLVLPEVALQWQVAGSSLDLAVTAPGPETEVFAAIAREYGTRILLGLFERDGDAVFNSAALIDEHGVIAGRYHKVHLAVGGESESGILPGDGFPVFDTGIGRVGCNICMDSSAEESARLVGLNGAEFLLLPIMGDHRADRWSPGAPVFNESRWRAIMRTRAIDNQLCLVVARNNVQGSCIVDRKGEFLAWNEGDRDWVAATVEPEDGYRTWNGGCFRGVNWMQRRPHVYGAFSEPQAFA